MGRNFDYELRRFLDCVEGNKYSVTSAAIRLYVMLNHIAKRTQTPEISGTHGEICALCGFADKTRETALKYLVDIRVIRYVQGRSRIPTIYALTETNEWSSEFKDVFYQTGWEEYKEGAEK